MKTYYPYFRYSYLLLIFLLHLKIHAQEKRSILTRTTTVENLKEWILQPEDWVTFPRYGENWENISNDLASIQVEMAGENLSTPIPQITAALLLDYFKTGNRSRHGAIYFGRRNRLADAVVAESLEHQGRFMEEIANLIWAICEESWWVIPAHYGQHGENGLPGTDAEYVDLFAAETGALLAWTHYLLKEELDKVSPTLNQRILTEIDRRILKPNFEKDDFWWMGLQEQSLNNWTPWICSNWLTCVLITEKDTDLRAKYIYKILGTLDRFLDPYPADGGCDEGPGYWGRAGASLFECLELLELSTGGKINVWNQDLIRNIGQYIYKVHIMGDYYINFADASAQNRPSPVLVYLYGKKIKDSKMMAFGSWLAHRQKLSKEKIGSSLSRRLATLQTLPQLLSTNPEVPHISQSWFPDLQVMVCRSEDPEGKGLFFAAKGGHNDESHNHNDVGNFIIYFDGKPMVIDAGVETYTKKTFSKQRYEIWTMQSQYHNLPTINGVQQQAGEEFLAQNTSSISSKTKTTFSLDIAKAYPDSADVDKWLRTFVFDRKKKKITLTDSYQLSKVEAPMVMNFLTAGKPIISKTKSAVLLGYKNRGTDAIELSFPQNFVADFEEIPIEDARLGRVWGEKIFRVQLTDKSPGQSGEYEFSFSGILPGDDYATDDEEMPRLKNPVTEKYLKTRLRKSSPRLVLTPEIEKNLKAKLKADPVVKNYYQAIRLNATQIQAQPLLTRNVIGRRLLGTSREMLYRMGILSMVYRIEKDPAVLNRINDEILAVCNFEDWNPSHYLDVAEMAMAVAIAIDWVGKDLPQSTLDLALSSLIEKGIKPSYNEDGNVGWIDGSNNWNQVCNGGMIAASIVIADKDPELASKTISRALDGIPHALTEYGPDGVYPEGSTYWGYGTSFSVTTSSMLQSAFGTDFGLAQYPAFLESANFRLLSIAPTGWYYNFADCGDKRGGNGDIILAWFATHTGNSSYLERERFLKPPESMGKLSRHAGPGLVWLSQFENKDQSNLPKAWKGEGANPIVIFRDEANDPDQYYFGGKGGRGTVNHGNMDAGSFIFELDGVRWIVDPGNQSYHALEQTGFKLWDRCQDCQRWTLLTKNNFGHSTLTINDALHAVDGFASIIDFKDGDHPEATFDMSAVFGGEKNTMTRKFLRDSDRSVLIEDDFALNDSIRHFTWQLMTTADVEIVKGGAVLKQDGKELKVNNLSHPEVALSVISLDPPPLELDRKIDGLKRIELRLPAYLFAGETGKVSIQLSGQ